MYGRKISSIGETVNDGEHTIEVTSLSGSENEAVAMANDLIIGNVAPVLTSLFRTAHHQHGCYRYKYYMVQFLSHVVSHQFGCNARASRARAPLACYQRDART